MLAVPLALLATGCSSGDRRHEITQTRVVPGGAGKLHVPSWERFGYRRKQPGQPGQQRTPKPEYTYQVPAGWTKLEPKPLRDVNLRVGDVECYVSTLTGGGPLANINRWRQQMSMPNLSPEELAQLPHRKLLGREGALVELVGSFTNRGVTRPGTGLVAVYVQFPAFAVSVKMIGPAADVAAATAGFEQLLTSLKIDMSGLSQDATGSHGAGHGTGSSNTTSSFDRNKLRWDMPSGWQLASGSSIRVVTFKIPGKASAKGGGAECWVTDLHGVAGGVIDNINRWRREMQKPPLSAQDVDRLPRVNVLGQQSPLLEEEGSYRGMGGPTVEKGMLFGVVCPLADVTVFVKMVGEIEDMRAAKNDFLKFCASLRIEP